MNDPYKRLRAIIEAAEARQAQGRPRAGTVGELLLERVRALGEGEALLIEATAREVQTFRKGARRGLEPGERLTIYRLDPRGPGGANRKTTWEAVLIRPRKGAA